MIPGQLSLLLLLDPARIDEAHERACAERMIKSGTIDPDCASCQRYFGAAFNGEGSVLDVFAPRHRASDRCLSGQRPHCTCGTCF